jgi:hypothetical protein
VDGYAIFLSGWVTQMGVFYDGGWTMGDVDMMKKMTQYTPQMGQSTLYPGISGSFFSKKTN